MLASAGQREEWYANFSEIRKAEVRGINLPRTPVNKGIKKGRGCSSKSPGPSRVLRPLRVICFAPPLARQEQPP
jgi:hypothetical protein